MAYYLGHLMISFLPAGFETRYFEPGDGGLPPGGAPPPPAPPGPATRWRTFEVSGYGGAQGDPSQENMEMRMLLQNALMRLGGPLNPDEMQPRSMADLDALESSLTEALEEVRALRARFT